MVGPQRGDPRDVRGAGRGLEAVEPDAVQSRRGGPFGIEVEPVAHVCRLLSLYSQARACKWLKPEFEIEKDVTVSYVSAEILKSTVPGGGIPDKYLVQLGIRAAILRGYQASTSKVLIPCRNSMSPSCRRRYALRTLCPRKT